MECPDYTGYYAVAGVIVGFGMAFFGIWLYSK